MPKYCALLSVVETLIKDRKFDINLILKFLIRVISVAIGSSLQLGLKKKKKKKKVQK